ncbi:hypothetical protein GY31_04965 [Lysinibacillus sphaericus]|uniref:flagellin N-terminal helical domain-containing protein n=1 Tax=Lysinibacillus TaxID=400634 RepID=UPI00084AFCCB|nr:flagellin [Lysinibacillus sphaericus]OEC02395.1 hypothetical protein GY31_04965 [Lysinibacillus sphaericus]
MKIQQSKGLFTQNRYNHLNTELNKTLNKLSTGYQVNKAADNAAGLGISEKMRGQIRGLEQAEQNGLAGISLIQTAESGLAQIQNPNLIRLRELTLQACNDTLTNQDRALIQKEIDAIKSGINDIANNTEYNMLHPLRQEKLSGYFEIEGAENYIMNKYLALNVTPDGSFDLRTNLGYPGSENDDNRILIYGAGKATTQPSLLVNGSSSNLKANILQPTTYSNGIFKTVYSINDIQVTQFVKLVEDQFEFKYSIENTSSSPQNVGFYFHMDTMLDTDDRAPIIVDNQQLAYEKGFVGSDVPNSFEVFNNAGNSELKAKGTITGNNILIAPDEFRVGQYTNIQSPAWTDNNRPVGDSGYALKWNERALTPGETLEVNTFYGLDVPPTVTDSTWTPSTVDSDYLLLQVGPNAGHHFKVVLTDARTTSLGIDGLNVLTREDAEQSLAFIDNASLYVSKERSKYGAYQNALEHILTNVNNAKENLISAESKLRDTDMAKEISKLQKDQVLLQASQSMMAHINQTSQGVLELLK